MTGQQILDALEMGARNYPEEIGGFLHVSGLKYTIDGTLPSTVATDARAFYRRQRRLPREGRSDSG